MKTTNTGLAVFAAALMLGAGAAFGNQLASFILTGHVTAVSAGDSLSLDGHVYRIKSGSPAAAAAPKLAKGAAVDVVLDGPPNTSASAVVNIVLHQDR